MITHGRCCIVEVGGGNFWTEGQASIILWGQEKRRGWRIVPVREKCVLWEGDILGFSEQSFRNTKQVVDAIQNTNRCYRDVLTSLSVKAYYEELSKRQINLRRICNGC